MSVTAWAKLPVKLVDLCLATTLRCGQSFRWKQQDDQSWICTLRGRIVQLTQDEGHLQYRSIWPQNGLTTPDDTRELIKHYLNLEPDLQELYKQWSEADANFRKRAPQFTGIRILRQDAWEVLVGFICSSNNNIIRISQMVDKLCKHYGQHIAKYEGQEYHDFPTPQSLTGKNVESHLRELGFGYRAKYIARTASMIANDHESGWLDSLRNPENPAYGQSANTGQDFKSEGRDGYRAAHDQLLTLQGVGPKVADCVCLMGLGWGESVPIDTHVWQIAVRDYKFGRGKHGSLTKVTYDAVANHFRTLWGKEAGWAHSVLFAADLRVFADRTTKVVVKEEVVVKTEEPATLVVASESRINKINPVIDTEEDTKRLLEVDETIVTNTRQSKRQRRR